MCSLLAVSGSANWARVKLVCIASADHLILRSRAQRGVSKDGNQTRCCPPFETHRFAMLLRARSCGFTQSMHGLPHPPRIEEALGIETFLYAPRQRSDRGRLRLEHRQD